MNSAAPMGGGDGEDSSGGTSHEDDDDVLEIVEDSPERKEKEVRVCGCFVLLFSVGVCCFVRFTCVCSWFIFLFTQIFLFEHSPYQRT